MSSLKVSSLAGRVSGDAPTLTDGAVLPVGVALTGGGGINVTGIITGSSYRGDGSQLTGIDASALKSGGSVKVQATATGAEVTGNLSVGGTLTYQDVQNVDSVGLVTARSGLVVVSGGASITAGGLNVTGVITATSYSGSGANLTGIDAAPTIDLVADGAVAANTSVIVTSAGKAKTIVGYANSMGNEIDVASTTASSNAYSSVAEDASTGRVVYLYRNNAVNPNATYYRVGTRTGTSVTWGTAATIQDGACDGGYTQIVNIGADKFFAIYKSQGDAHYYTRVLTTTSSNTATLGTHVVMTDTSNNNLSDVRLPQLAYNTSTGAIIGIYGQNGGASGGIVARMWTVSGSTITRGAPVQLRSSVCETMDATWLQYKSSMVAVYRWNNNQFNYSLIKEPASGTTVTYINGNVTSNTGGNHAVTFDSTNNVLHTVYQYSGDGSWQYYAGVWQASGGTGDVSWGSGVFLQAGGSNVSTSYDYGNIIYQPDAKQYLFVAEHSSNGYRITFSPGGTLGGTSQTLTSADGATQFSTSFNRHLMKIGGSGAVLVPYNSSGLSKLRIRQYASTTLTTGNFVGFSDGTSYSDGQTVKIKVVGNTSTQSSLTAGSLYYVQTDGTLGTTAATPSVVAGKAISSTKLLIQPV